MQRPCIVNGLTCFRAHESRVCCRGVGSGDGGACVCVLCVMVIVCVCVFVGSRIAALHNDDDYQDLMDDINEECAKSGAVVSCVIPRPVQGESVMGVGKVFVRMGSLESAVAVHKVMNGMATRGYRKGGVSMVLYV